MTAKETGKGEALAEALGGGVDPKAGTGGSPLQPTSYVVQLPNQDHKTTPRKILNRGFE